MTATRQSVHTPTHNPPPAPFFLSPPTHLDPRPPPSRQPRSPPPPRTHDNPRRSNWRWASGPPSRLRRCPPVPHRHPLPPLLQLPPPLPPPPPPLPPPPPPRLPLALPVAVVVVVVVAAPIEYKPRRLSRTWCLLTREWESGYVSCFYEIIPAIVSLCVRVFYLLLMSV